MFHARLTSPLVPRRRHSASTASGWLAFAAVTLLSACASTPPPKAELAVAEAAVANATNAGATQWAPAEMRTAQDKLVRAQSAMTAKEHSQALMLAQQADVDAQLAAAAARSAKSRRAADEVQEANRVLREELSRRPVVAPGTTPRAP